MAGTIQGRTAISDAWGLIQRDARSHLAGLENALKTSNFEALDKHLHFFFHNYRQRSSQLIPLLEKVGAEALVEAWRLDADELWDRDLRKKDNAHVERFIVDLRDHLDTAEDLLLPLVKAQLKVPDDRPYLILEKELLAPETWSFVVQAPLVARGRKPGQFIMVSPFERSERIPLTLVGGDAEKGYIRFVMMEVGETTRTMAKMDVGEALYAVAGPMGTPTELVREGTVVLVAGGYGAGAVLTAAEVLHARGQRVITILGGRSRERVLLTSELQSMSAELLITTDDGSWGRQGRVTDTLQDVLSREPVAQVIAVGPMPMMEAVATQTLPFKIPTLVSLNALMVDGTGMCGGCRVNVGGEVKFACFHGPDFDGHKVDFAGLRSRQSWYQEDEDHRCRIDRRALPPEVIREQVQEVHPGEGARCPQIKGAERAKIQRQDMPCQTPEARILNFKEVAIGYSHEQACLEAQRCLQCKKPLCVEGCPVGIDIPAFIREIVEGTPAKGGEILKRFSALPAVCGRVCPQELQCEAKCVVGIKGKSVAIGRLERYAADALLRSGSASNPAKPTPTGKRVAVVGAGPAGLAVAGELVQKGHAITVYDAFSQPGGVLRYGIPEFRLPNAIVDAEVQSLRDQGVQFVMNTLIGRSLSLDDLQRDFDAVFLGTGAGLPKLLRIPGEDAKGVYTANEFLTRVNLMRADLFPEYGTPVTVGKHVIVVGCGNTAMDAARCARRLGAEVTVMYRRSVQESTARHEELEHAIEEGVNFRWLTTPVSLQVDEDGWIRTAECARMELTEAGSDGRRGVRDTGERERVEVDTFIVALGCAVNPLLAETDSRLQTLRGGVVRVDDETGETTLPGVFAGGDVITGGATVILAMGQAHRAAQAMDRYLMGDSEVE